MSNQDESMRLFIGVPLSMRSLRAVANAAADLRERAGDESKCSWVAPARYHVTLAYLGWAKPAVVPAIVDAVGKAIAGHKPFEMRCADFGAFPSLEATKVLWAGIPDRMGEVAKLASAVQSACRELGFAVPQREFHPHVTMGRIDAGEDFVTLAQESPAHVFSKSSVETLILYKSSVESDASEHKKIAQWSLRHPLE